MTSIVTRSRSGAKKSSAALTGNMIYQDAVSNDSNTTSLDETGASSRSRNCKDKSKKSKAKKKKRSRTAFNDVSNNQQHNGSSSSSSQGAAKKVKVNSKSRSKSKSKSSKSSRSNSKTTRGRQMSSQVQQRQQSSTIDLTGADENVNLETAPPPAPQAVAQPGVDPGITNASSDTSNQQEGAQQVTSTNQIDPLPTSSEDPPLPLKCVQPKAQRVINIDAEFANDPRYATAYANEVFAFRKQHELLYRPQGDFLKNFQNDITPNMRAILVDWLVEVAEEYNLKEATLFTSVNYIDRCLAFFQVTRHQLQLLGCACMLIASKYEEIYAPCVDEFVYISDNTYSHDQVLRMESKVLGYLKFRLTVCTIMTFLPRYLRASHAQSTFANEEAKKRVEYLAGYFAELALQDYEMVHYRQSTIAAACVSLARRTLKMSDIWHKTLAHYTGYDLRDIKTCELRLLNRHQSIRFDKLQAVRRKHSSQDFMKVAYIEPLRRLEN